MSAQQLAQALRRLIAELPVRVTNDQQLISLSVAHIEGIGQACVKALQAIEAAPQQEPAIIVTIDDLDLVQDWAESRLPPGTHKLYAAPQQEPVAEVYRAHPGGRSRNIGLNDVRPLRGATLPPPGTKLYAAPQQAQDKLDAERWREMLMRVGATSWFNGGHMFMVNLQAPPNVMQGSVAQHFTAAIDAARKAKS